MIQKIILASSSPRRKEILTQVGISFLAVTADIVETIKEGSTPEEAVKYLAEQKAEAVFLKRGSKEVILAADTVVVCDGKILGKPEDKEKAREMITLLAGREHEVLTGVCFLYEEKGMKKKEIFAEKTRVTIRNLTYEEIEEYISRDEPYDKAGGYGVQGYFARYVEKIEGDYYNIVGLPICHIDNVLKEIYNRR